MTTDIEPQAVKKPRRTRVLEALLKGIDVTIGLVAVVGGIYALVAPPPSIIREVSIPALVVLWGVLLIGGGFAGAVGRVTGIWILETTGIAGMGFGAAIYLVVVSTAIADELGVVVAVSLITIAMLALMRRYVELQLFLREPEEHGVLPWLVSRVRIRTAPAGR